MKNLTEITDIDELDDYIFKNGNKYDINTIGRMVFYNPRNNNGNIEGVSFIFRDRIIFNRSIYENGVLNGVTTYYNYDGGLCSIQEIIHGEVKGLAKDYNTIGLLYKRDFRL